MGVELLTRRLRGQCFTYEGAVDGRKLSVDIPVETIETMSEANANALVKRQLQNLAQYAPDHRFERLE